MQNSGACHEYKSKQNTAIFLRSTAKKMFFSPCLARLFSFEANSRTAFCGGHACDRNMETNTNTGKTNTNMVAQREGGGGYPKQVYQVKLPDVAVKTDVF